MQLHDLVLDYLREKGYNVDSWMLHEFSASKHPANKRKYPGALFVYRYSVIPGLQYLQVIETKDGGYVALKGPLVDFDGSFSVKDPDSLDLVEEKIRKLYIWMKNIRPDWSEEDWIRKKDTIDESAGSNSQPSIRDSVSSEWRFL